jgi:undecaprenyl phosphate-alpha-L-ara4N flippase subunit ArnE
MPKILVILILALAVEAVGVVYLSRGLKQIGGADRVTPRAVARLLRRGATNPNLLLGVALEAAFFAALLYLLSQRDVSLIWPLTSLGFVLTALAARLLLHEEIDWMRWCGIGLIVLGAGLACFSETRRPKRSSLPATPPAAPADPG